MPNRIHSLLALRAVAPLARAAEGLGAPDHELLCYGDIGESWFGESVSAKDVVSALQEAQASHVRVRINSYGGSVSDGIAIYNSLRALSANGVKVSVRIEGVAASIASLIAMASDTREMYPNTMMMIHAPWAVTAGNSTQMREAANVLDAYAKAMSTSYARATGRSAAEELEKLNDGIDHWLSAEDAIAQGYATAMLDIEVEQSETEAKSMPRQAPVWAAMSRYRNAPAAIAASLGTTVTANRFVPVPVTQKTLQQPAARAANPQESFMNFKALAQNLGLKLPENATDAQAKAAVLAHLNLNEAATDSDVGNALATQSAHAELRAANARTSEQARRNEIASAFAGFRARGGAYAEMERQCLDDMSISAQTARDKLLAKLGEGAEPLNAGLPRIEAGETSAEKLRGAAVTALLVRAGVQQDPKTKQPIAYDGQNPFRGRTLNEVARMSLESSGVNANSMDALDMVRASLGVQRVRGAQTTSDFPVILENVLHKMVLMGFYAWMPTYQRFTRIGDVSDFREWKRFVPGIIANLEVVNEAAEYRNKNIPDAESLPNQVKRHGNIIEVTPEVIVNDDLGAIMEIARQLGMAGPRTIEREVYRQLALNSGAGPTMPDGNPLFHTSRGNIAVPGGPVSVAMLAAGADAMAEQTAPGEDAEPLDISPRTSVSRHTTARDIQVLVESQYDAESTGVLGKPNKVRGIVMDIVGSTRVASPRWYLFADPMMAPVFEVVFLNGQREVRVVQEENFRTAGLAWRGELPFGVAPIDYRGGWFNDGVA